MLESNLRRSLLLSRDGYAIFFERPISATLIAIDAVLILASLYMAYRGFRAARRERREAQAGLNARRNEA
ncbi:hypothetical protein [Martelella soudanensis]|uniref:hypothetical protein n=1 Tax=unclassified Martelella TaxID=2629616 RepID=UPI0015DD9085|nr:MULTISPECIES: hypothetical protein [unclassified Martelella]